MVKARCQTQVVVYMTYEEKEELRQAAKEAGRSMSQYLFDLHKLRGCQICPYKVTIDFTTLEKEHRQLVLSFLNFLKER